MQTVIITTTMTKWPHPLILYPSSSRAAAVAYLQKHLDNFTTNKFSTSDNGESNPSIVNAKAGKETPGFSWTPPVIR